MSAWMWLVVPAAVLLYVIWTFNRMVALRVRARNAWSDVDVQLKRRADLVPSLVETVRGYAGHEADTLARAVAARAHAKEAEEAPPEARSHAEGEVSREVGRLFALVEAYPELRADASFQSLHRSLVDIEEHLQAARRYYNAVVRDYNTLIEQVPASFIAALFRFRAREFFRLESAAEAEAPGVALAEEAGR
jgi:LemA protein